MKKPHNKKQFPWYFNFHLLMQQIQQDIHDYKEFFNIHNKDTWPSSKNEELVSYHFLFNITKTHDHLQKWRTCFLPLSFQHDSLTWASGFHMTLRFKSMNQWMPSLFNNEQEIDWAAMVVVNILTYTVSIQIQMQHRNFA